MFTKIANAITKLLNNYTNFKSQNINNQSTNTINKNNTHDKTNSNINKTHDEINNNDDIMHYENNTDDELPNYIDNQEDNNIELNKSDEDNFINVSSDDMSICSSENNEDLNKYIEILEEKGYVIIPNVYNQDEINDYWYEFNKWMSIVPNLNYLHNVIDFNGIFKHHQVGHQRFAWQARTNPKILNIFKKLWNTDDLVTSFDGCCYYPSNYENSPTYWTHSDQSSLKKGLNCYQSFLSLTNNCERTLIIYEATHKCHQSYFKTMGIEEPRDWNIIDENYLINNHMEKQRFLNVKAGDLVIWDSRTFHQNTCGNLGCNEERLIQYLCYLPKNNVKNDEKERKQRIKFFEKKRTTSHWPYPMNVVPEQPNMYNYYYPGNKIYIDYETLPKPYLDDLLPEINKLL